MGSPTFGKATMQIVLPLDTNIIAKKSVDEKKYNPDKKYDDYVKVTTGKLYRISGETNQQKGVIPDIELPDAFAPFDYTERSLSFSLASDTIVHTVPYSPITGRYPSEKFPSITKEVNNDFFFSKLNQWVSEMKKRNENTMLPLQWEKYAEYQAFNLTPNADSTFNHVTVKAENTTYTNRMLELGNEWEKEANQWVLEDLITDPYIRSAFYTMTKLFF
jgi:carboxyl-terminal processing protease